MIEKLVNRIYAEVWFRNLAETPRATVVAIRFVRFLWAIALDVATGQLTLRAMSLVFTSLLALVPLLAFSFALLRAFGAHNQLEPVLNRLLMGLGERGPELTAQIVGFVENVRVGVLGSVGLLILLYTVISLVQKIEDGFNYAWRVPKGRSLAHRFSGYISVITVGPLLIFGALGIIGLAQSQAMIEWLLDNRLVGPVMALSSRLLPIAMIAIAFTLFYILVPNTRVRFRPALIGGLLAAFLWELVGSMFANFVVASGRHTAVYATFAAPLLFMLWLYLSWMILLLGSQVAFYIQNPQFITPRRGGARMDHAMRERLALSVMYLVARTWGKSSPRWTFDALTRQLHVDSEPMSAVTRRLLQRGLLVEIGDSGCYAPGRDPDAITLYEIVAAMRHDGGLAAEAQRGLSGLSAVEAVQKSVDDSVQQGLGDRTLRDLIKDPNGD
ncbi:MAG: YihY/virulence factor BrkB family protein [Xanthomonadaceae bacterium]|nr:YihY/virulence factor BrkB family protein [Xanthomonadaceae bacterium]